MLRGELRGGGPRGAGKLALACGLAFGLIAAQLPPALASPTPPGHQVTKVRASTQTAARSRKAAARTSGDAVGKLLVYGGGEVRHAPQVYLSFWGQDWSSAALQPAVDYLNAFFANVGGSDWLNSTTQYCSGNVAPPRVLCTGSQLNPITNGPGQLRGVWNDPAAVGFQTPPENCGLLQADSGDCDVMLAAGRAATHFGQLPPGAIIIVLTPSGQSQPGFVAGGWCAYHSSIPVGGPVPAGGTPFGYVPFVPDAGFSCGQGTVNAGAAGQYDGFSIIAGHEYVEAITDPFPTSGWIDSGGAENADKCAWVDLANISLSGRQFAVQTLWSNASAGCVLGMSGAPPPVPNLEYLGGILTSAPAAASWSPGRLDVFARGADSALWHRWSESGSWSSWEYQGGILASEPAAAAWSANRLDVFVRGVDNQLWHKWWDGGSWNGWEPLGGVVTSAPAVASWSANRLDVFLRSSDNGLWHRWWDGSAWSNWERQGGVLTSSPAAVSWGPNRVDVLLRSSDNGLWHKWWDGTQWSDWESQGGAFSSGPAASSGGVNRMDVFGRGTDNSLWRKTWDGSRWSGWAEVGGVWASGPAVAAQQGTGSVDVFEVGSGTALWHGRLT